MSLSPYVLSTYKEPFEFLMHYRYFSDRLDPKEVESKCVKALLRGEIADPDGFTPSLVTCVSSLFALTYSERTSKMCPSDAFINRIQAQGMSLSRSIQPIFDAQGGAAAVEAMIDAYKATEDKDGFLRYVSHAVQSAYDRIQNEEEKE